MSWPQPQAPTGTVMPLVEAHPTPDGLRLVNRADRGVASFAIRVVVGLMFVLVGATMAMPGLVIGSTLPIFIGVVAVVGGLAVLGSAATWVYRRTTLDDAHLDLPQLPLRLGATVTARFSQRRTGRSEIRSISATLTCREWVRYQQGTTTRTDTHHIWSHPLPAPPNDPLGNSTEVTGTWRLHIPPELPPSFAMADNAVQWLFTVRADVANRPDIVNTFVLPVLPEVLRDFR